MVDSHKSIEVTRNLLSVFPNVVRKYNVSVDKSLKNLSLKWDCGVVIFIFFLFPRFVIVFTDVHFIVRKNLRGFGKVSYSLG